MIRRVKKRKSKFFTFLVMIAIAVFAYKTIIAISDQPFLRKIIGNKVGLVPTLTVASGSDVSIPADNLNSPNAILICLDDQSIIMQKESDQKIYPASLTKMMTTIVAIENLPDLQKKIELPNPMFQKLYNENASMAGFEPDEKVKAIDLLYGVMLPSGAECCIGTADHIAGSEQGFVEKMNQKAEALGMSNTHFTNCTGLQDENHYTTVKDLSILLSYALQNDTFRDIFTTSRYSTAPTGKHPDGITFYSTMFKNIENPAINGGEILGGKTGFTDEAGLCLASLAQKDGKEYVLVTAGANGNHKTEQYDIDDAYAVYNKI